MFVPRSSFFVVSCFLGLDHCVLLLVCCCWLLFVGCGLFVFLLVVDFFVWRSSLLVA